MGSKRTTVLLGLVALATVGVYASFFFLDTTRDDHAVLDVDPVQGRASTACTALRVALDALPPLGPDASREARLDRLAVQDRDVRGLVADVRSLGDPALRKDVPAEQWLGDWTALADARQAYAAAGAQGPFAPPVVDGHPLSERMGRIGVPACVVPVPLTVAP